MRWIYFFISALLTGLLIFGLSRPWGSVSFAGGSFFHPYQGFWKNAAPRTASLPASLQLPELKAPVEIWTDEYGIPHIFAENPEDLAYAQGYVTAHDRLWQMEFQTHAAAGRLTEIVGRGKEDVVLKLDQESRRKGLAWAAEKVISSLEKNTEVRPILTAYTKGVNAYINSLRASDFPVEYKILNYRPEEWSNYKTALLLKYMANTLTGRSEDLENTYAQQVFGKEMFDLLYPQQPFKEAPIIPAGTPFDFTNELYPPTPTKSFKKKPFTKPAIHSPTIGSLDQIPLMEKPPKGLGSNNWAVAGSKTQSGSPILCNDPHLGLNLPSIWYEIQLQMPQMNCYGASLPGAPGIISGFNDSIAWGVTNAGIDVMDFYKIKFKDATKSEYEVAGKWEKSEKRIEIYRIKGGETVQDTVIYTLHGPVVYEDTPDGDLALRWTAHDPSLEALTFLKLNTARNYKDYSEALSYYQCPGQNFAFAARNGDIAIWQQGKFPNKYPSQGMFLLDGADTLQAWRGYIPANQTPHILNPERGYVSSANQAPTDASYPYWYSSCMFESARNRRLNRRLDSLKSITIADMQALQLDNYSMFAEDILPTFLREMDSVSLSSAQSDLIEKLKKWDYFYEKDAVPPTIFEIWWHYIQNEVWADEFEATKLTLGYPDRPQTLVLLRDSLNFRFYDNITTKEKIENRRDVIRNSFQKMADSLQRISPNSKDWAWTKVKRMKIQHLTRVIKPFGHYDVPVGGNASILNAITQTGGPSWRMVVSMGKEIECYAVYPGGESGNPGSPYYDNFLSDWIEGKYHKAIFLQNRGDIQGNQMQKTIVTK